MTHDIYDRVTCSKCGHDQNTSNMMKCEICGAALKGKKGIPAAALAGAVAIAGLGVAGYSFLQRRATDNPNQPMVVVTATPSGPVTPGTPPATFPSQSAANLLSEGDRVLFANAPDIDKTAAASAYSNGQYSDAIALLEAARQRRRNDPETLIYLNNAKVGDRDAVYVAAAVPVADNPNSAQEILRGVAQVQQAHNDSGNGLPLKVIIADDANDKAQAQAVANALVDDKRVRLVVGHGTSTTSLAGAEIYQAAGLPMIAPTSTSTELAALTRTGTNFVYRTIPSDQFSGTILARYVLEKMGKKSAAVFFNSESAYSRSMKRAFETTFGLEGGLVSETIDFASENGVARLTDASAEVVALFPNSSTFAQALEVARANNKRLPMVAGDAMYTVNALREAGESLEGMILPVPWHPVSSAEPNFVASSSQLWGGDVNWRTALSYDAMQTLTAAFSAAEQSREALAQTIGESNFSARGVTGDIRFLPTGDRSGSLVLVRVQPGDRSKTGYDFVPIQ